MAFLENSFSLGFHGTGLARMWIKCIWKWAPILGLAPVLQCKANVRLRSDGVGWAGIRKGSLLHSTPWDFFGTFKFTGWWVNLILSIFIRCFFLWLCKWLRHHPPPLPRLPCSDTITHIYYKTHVSQGQIFAPRSPHEGRVSCTRAVQDLALEPFLILHEGAGPRLTAGSHHWSLCLHFLICKMRALTVSAPGIVVRIKRVKSFLWYYTLTY